MPDTSPMPAATRQGHFARLTPFKPAQQRGMSAMLRRLASRRAKGAVAALALLTWGAASAQASTYNYTGGGAGTTSAPISGNFSTGFVLNGGGAVTSPVGATTSDTLSFGGTSGATTYTATDDLTSQILAGGLSFSNAGAVTIARSAAVGANNSLTLASNVFTATGSGAVTFNLDLVLSAPSTNQFSIGSGGATLSGAVSGTGPTFQKTGTGTLTLTAANTYTGQTTIQQGVLQVGSGGTTGTLGTSASSITDNASLIFNRSDGLTFYNIITGIGTLTVQGGGTFTAFMANTYLGGTTIAASTLLAITNGSALGTGTVSIPNTTAGAVTGTLRVSNNIAVAGFSTITVGGVTVTPLTSPQASGTAQIENLSGNNSLSANINVTTGVANGFNANILSDA